MIRMFINQFFCNIFYYFPDNNFNFNFITVFTLRISPKKGTCDSISYNGLIALISASDLIGLAILGPFPSMIVKSTPIAGSGVKISENMSLTLIG